MINMTLSLTCIPKGTIQVFSAPLVNVRWTVFCGFGKVACLSEKRA